jgi:uncharacterized protein
MRTNIFGEELKPCSVRPRTGFYRNGCCDTDKDDPGVHSVCVIVTSEFLEFSRQNGNDLSTARPEWDFAGLLPGDRWCLCAERWVEAWLVGVAPLVVLESTHEKTLDYVPLKELVKFAYTSISPEINQK